MKLIIVFIFLTGLANYAMAQSNYTTYKVVVRSYFSPMTSSKANSLDQLYQGHKSELMTSNSATGGNNNGRHLRATSRELLTWCQTYCPGQCNWCKTNDVYFGQDCDNFCRRRGEEGEPRDLQTTDGLAIYPSSMALFTAEQKKDCALILASMVRAVNINLCNSLGGSTISIHQHHLFFASTNIFAILYLTHLM
jgi:hypothetical protein